MKFNYKGYKLEAKIEEHYVFYSAIEIEKSEHLEFEVADISDDDIKDKNEIIQESIMYLVEEVDRYLKDPDWYYEECMIEDLKYINK